MSLRLVAITAEAFAADEAATIRRLVEGGIDRVHVRKPGAAEADVRRLIEALPAALYPRLTLHDCLPLAVEYGLGGVHLNGRNPAPPPGFRGMVSRSCHSLDELAGEDRGGKDCPQSHGQDQAQDQAVSIGYRFLSPIFDSLSKRGYRAAFSDAELRAAALRGMLGERVYALGGVTPERLPQVRAWGFGGAALLGYLWRDTSDEGLRRTLRELQRYRNE